MRGRLNVTLPKELDERFREVVFKKHNFKMMHLSECVEEAIEMWVKHEEDKFYEDD